MKQAPPIRVVGGGMTGLTLALRLSQRGQPVVVHEQVPYLGGLSSEGTLAGVPIERFYHCVLPTDDSLLGLLDEVGLSNELGWTKTRTGFFTGDGLLEMTTTMDFLRFPALGLMDRLRLGWTIAYCGANRNWRRLDREPVGRFLRRHSGRRLFESIWEPLLLAKLGPNYDRFAASFIWATVVRMLSARRAKGNSEKLGFVTGRYGKVFQALRVAIEQNGGSVVAGEAVTGLQRGERARWQLQTAGDWVDASGVALCVPAPVAAPWVRPFSQDAARSLETVDYLGVICDVLLLRRQLTPYYILNLTERDLPFTGVIETSNLTGTDEFHGHSLVYLPRYCDADSPLWQRDDESIHQENMTALKRIVPDLEEADVAGWQVNRARHVQPVHPVGWGDRLPPVELESGLAYLSTAHIHPWPVFNDEVVRLVERQLGPVSHSLNGAAPR